jgi:hypothetical protein
MADKPQPLGGNGSGWTLNGAVTFLLAKIDGVKEHLTDIANEREARTAERFSSSEEAVKAALVATKEQAAAALASAEKAILKAEAAQEKRQDAGNEIRAAMIDQQRNLAGKAETEVRFVALETRLQERTEALTIGLQEVKRDLAASGGRTQGIGQLAGWIAAALVLIISVAGFVIDRFP